MEAPDDAESLFGVAHTFGAFFHVFRISSTYLSWIILAKFVVGSTTDNGVILDFWKDSSRCARNSLNNDDSKFPVDVQDPLIHTAIIARDGAVLIAVVHPA